MNYDRSRQVLAALAARPNDYVHHYYPYSAFVSLRGAIHVQRSIIQQTRRLRNACEQGVFGGRPARELFRKYTAVQLWHPLRWLENDHREERSHLCLRKAERFTELVDTWYRRTTRRARVDWGHQPIIHGSIQSAAYDYWCHNIIYTYLVKRQHN